MKQQHSSQPKFQKFGFTLIELSVVILVLLSLVGVLFVGSQVWKRGTDRSAAIVTIRNTQMAVRSHLRLAGIDEALEFENLPQEIFGSDKYVVNGFDQSGSPNPNGSLPEHPAVGQSFGFVAENGNIVPRLGELYICTGGTTGLNNYTYNPFPSSYEGW